MAVDPSPKSKDKEAKPEDMLEHVPDFELDLPGSTSLNLDTDIPDIGQIAELTDVVLLLFQDIDDHLNRYLISSDESEKADLHKEIKRFLGRINANKLIPLSFRLNVLRTFCREAAILDADLTHAILNAYKVAIMIVLDVAEDKEDYLLALSELCGEAVSLAMRVARLHLKEYRESSSQVTRQVYEITRLGLAALGKVKNSPQERKFRNRINHALAWYELMLVADFFRLTPAGQDVVYESLEPYIKNVQPIYCPRRQSALSKPEHIYLVSHVGERQKKPQWSKGLRPIADRDRVILDITALLPVLKQQLASVEAHMQDTQRQRRDLKTEEEVHLTYTVTKHMMRCLRIIPRQHERNYSQKETVGLVANIEAALRMPHRSSFPLMPAGVGEEEEKVSYWDMFNVSEAGMAVETDKAANLPKVASLVRVVWPHSEPVRPFWALVSWRRHLVISRRVHMGLHFLPQPLFQWWVQPIGGGVSVQDRRPVLGAKLKGKGNILIWSSNTSLYAGSSLLFDSGKKLFTSKVVNVVQRGDNFVVCRVQVQHPFTPAQAKLEKG